MNHCPVVHKFRRQHASGVHCELQFLVAFVCVVVRYIGCNVGLEAVARIVQQGYGAMKLAASSRHGNDGIIIRNERFRFSFVGQTKLAPSAFAATGVHDFNTKIMVFLRKSVHIGMRAYSAEEFITVEELKNASAGQGL